MVDEKDRNRTALITGASRGLGYALAAALAADGWKLIVNARGHEDLETAAKELGDAVVGVVPGDLVDSWTRIALLGAAEEAGGLDLLVNNASVLGTVPLPRLADQPVPDLRAAFEVNTLAPLALTQAVLPLLRERAGAVLNISSDVAVEAAETWGGYGATKAALDQLSGVLAVEEPLLRVWAVDPGEMRTRMYREAAPGEDLSELPEPAERAVPGLLRLIERRAPSGRYVAAEAALESAAG